ENPALYDILEISELTYGNFDCVYLIGDEVVGIVVGKNSPYKSFTEIIEAAKKAPWTIKISTTGTGGLPWEVGAFITDITGAMFNQIPYDSDASAKTAVMNGECDFTVCKVQSGIEDWKAGDLKFLCMLATKPVPTMPDVPLVTAEYPDFAKYLPWGPFYGVFVKKGTDAGVIAKLSEAFTKAGPQESYQKVLANFNINFLGYSGEEAAKYISSWRENTVNALKSSGALD
ncbi:MAG: tripartite tricarboxylate transporter substrate binding protein, partial [Synergistaceae bacterium]|nr:tripartite tricarboxylate transporter substrate binding protein [Synergistaceae bacterium]